LEETRRQVQRDEWDEVECQTISEKRLVGLMKKYSSMGDDGKSPEPMDYTLSKDETQVELFKSPMAAGSRFGSRK